MRARRLFVGALFVSVVVGCAPATPETQCFKGVSVAATSVDAAMNIAGDLYRQGKIDDATKAKIIAAYEKYQHAGATILWGCKLAKSDQEASALIQEAVAAAAELTTLITELRK